MSPNINVPLLPSLKKLEIIDCDDLMVSRTFNSCARTLQTLRLYDMADYIWDLTIPPLSRLQSLGIGGVTKDISDCKLLRKRGKLKQLLKLRNLH